MAVNGSLFSNRKKFGLKKFEKTKSWNCIKLIQSRIELTDYDGAVTFLFCLIWKVYIVYQNIFLYLYLQQNTVKWNRISTFCIKTMNILLQNLLLHSKLNVRCNVECEVLGEDSCYRFLDRKQNGCSELLRHKYHTYTYPMMISILS